MTRDLALALQCDLGEAETVHRNGFCIGGVSVELTGSHRSDVTMVSSLEPFWAEAHDPDITIHIEWLRDLPAAPVRQLFDSGCTWRLYESGSDFRFDFYIAALGQMPYKSLLIDDHFSRARLQMSERAFARMDYSLSPLNYPLDELLIMHRLTQEKAIELHGCGIVRADGTGNLFVGHSGAGKSTTTRLWTEREDVEVLSDDRIIVRRVARDDREEKRVPHRAFSPVRNDNRMRMYGTPWHGEAMYASPGSAPLARIFVLEHGRGNVITRLVSEPGGGGIVCAEFCAVSPA